MLDIFRRNPLIAVLAVVAVALAVVLGIEISMGEPTSGTGPGRRGVAAEAKLLPPMVAVAPEQAYPETAARPLFSPTRRPAPEAVVATQPAFVRGQFVLLGVTIAGETRIAMLREKSSGRLHRVERSRDINGLKVLAIEPQVVTLGLGAETEQIPLTVQKGGGAPGQPGTPPPSAAAPQGPFGASSATPPPPGGIVPPPITPPNAMVPQGVPLQGVPNQGIPPPGATAATPNGAFPASTVNPTTDASGAPLSPEELLARRRARRAQQNQ